MPPEPSIEDGDDFFSSRDWHLCEGLLEVFMKPGARDQPGLILWQKELFDGNSNQGISLKD